MRRTTHLRRLVLGLVLAGGAPSFAATAADNPAGRAAIEAMKADPRGPFDQIRWFCKDGAVLMPTPGACKPHGGGHQHGQWSARTRELRAQGYRIANFFADLDLEALLAADRSDAPLAQMLVERFLVEADDGWILRRARYYRGAFQEEDERRGARELLLSLAGRAEWLDFRYLPLRTAAGLLPHGPETASIKEVRQLAATLSDRDPAFKFLRNKIHGRLARADAEAVEDYAANLPEARRADYLGLAAQIRALFDEDLGAGLEAALRAAAKSPEVEASLQALDRDWRAAADDGARLEVAARTLKTLRDLLAAPAGAPLRLALLDTSLLAESSYFTLAAARRTAPDPGTRRMRLARIGTGLDALYGTGLLSQRQYAAMRAELAQLDGPAPRPALYKQVLDYLALAPHWASQNYRLHFGSAMDKLAEIEPKAALFIQDQLRGSALLAHAELVDGLVRDANALNGIGNELFGADVGGGLRALNPGLAQGVLSFALDGEVAGLERDHIYVLPETVSDLPPVAGILTAGEGNPLSHVQLLARNLGIPNIAFDQRLLERLRAHAGERIVLAVSPGGAVRVVPASADTEALFAQAANAADETEITVDLAKLDLAARDFIDLRALRASDSGRTVGPKAAKLGELKAHYPDAVADGLAIPFGRFRALLEQPMAGETGSVFAWMKRHYAELAALPADSPARREATERFRARLEQWVATADPGEDFRRELGARMRTLFGADGSYGVFVRSDTNVEDLPGFTGAGLNLTLPNVVGETAIFAAIAKVWASPFTARSFAWRQSLMSEPEHVYPAVLLLKSVDNDKSGVLVTREIDTGSADWLSVAVNEGVGGAVDGQSAESLRIHVPTGRVRLLAQATTPVRRQLAPEGGIRELPVTGSESVLKPAEIERLIAFSRELPTRFPAIVDAAGQPAPADVEFGFQHGTLRLFQIRPFLDNARTRGLAYLQSLDAKPAGSTAVTVDLDAAPGGVDISHGDPVP
ncbi:MAG TPA: PEP/pyruvate-binding domain-containing protein [Gammaproteobacteria bacterium]|nr:PEP/pyruvate-binding domain-containing protein [Gammaproteobacteria bacterium]